MSESTSWTPGVAAAYYNGDYPDVPGVAAAYYDEDDLVAPGVAAAYNVEHMSAPGIRFVPTNRELIVDYLGRKLRGEPPPTDLVHDGHNAYAEHPKKLVPKLGEPVMGSWYLFSKRLRKYPGGMRPERAMGDDEGHWKATGKEKPILGGANRKDVLGTRRALTFHEDTYEVGSKGKRRRVKNKAASKPSKWKMVEFVCSNSCRAPGNKNNDTALDPMLLNNFVLCKITNRSLSLEGEGDEEEGDEEEQPTPEGGGGEPYEKHLSEQQQAGGGGAGTQAGQQQPGPSSGGGAASNGNQQPTPAEAPLVDLGDIFSMDMWFANANSMLPFDLYDTGPANERQKAPGLLSP